MTTTRTFELLAAAIAGRAICVHRPQRRTPIAISDGDAIYKGETSDDWRDVAAQAILIATGAFKLAILRELVFRPSWVARYTIAEFHRGLSLHQPRIPFSLLAAVQPGCTITGSREESLRLAKSDAELSPLPVFLAPIDALFALRRSGFINAGQKKNTRQILFETAHFNSPLPNVPASEKSAWAEALSGFFAPGFSSTSGQRRDKGKGSALDVACGNETATGQKTRFSYNPDLLTDAKRAPMQSVHFSRLPEWDRHRAMLRPDWVHVETTSAWRPDGAKDMSLAFSPPPAALYRKLGRLGASFRMNARQKDGPDLDINELIRFAVERRTENYASPGNIHRTLKRSERELGVSIMLDASGSSKTQSAGAETVFHEQAKLAQLVCEAFSGLGAATAMTAFQAWGRKAVRMTELKAPSSRWDSTVYDRMRLLQPCGFTRLGAAIRYGANHMKKNIRTRQRLLIVISDGIAFDYDYEGEYAQDDIRKALAEAQMSGCACLCLSATANAPDERLSVIFGEAVYIATDDISIILNKISAACEAALSTASRRTTTHG